MKTNVEKCNQILFAFILLMDVFITYLLICLVVVFVCERDVITVYLKKPHAMKLYM